MKMLNCADAGVKNCNFEITGENDDEIIRKAKEHGRQAHNIMLGPEQEQQIRSLIKTV